MKRAIIPATTRIVDLSRYQGRYDKVYFRNCRGHLQCVSIEQSGRVKPITHSVRVYKG